MQKGRSRKLYTPDGQCLIQGIWCVVKVIWRVWERTSCLSFWVGIVQNSNTSDSLPERLINKPCTRHNVIVTTCILIHGHQKWIWLPNMDIQTSIVLLWGVITLGFRQKQIMVLNPKIQTSGDSNIVHSYTVSFAYNFSVWAIKTKGIENADLYLIVMLSGQASQKMFFSKTINWESPPQKLLKRG